MLNVLPYRTAQIGASTCRAHRSRRALSFISTISAPTCPCAAKVPPATVPAPPPRAGEPRLLTPSHLRATRAPHAGVLPGNAPLCPPTSSTRPPVGTLGCPRNGLLPHALRHAHWQPHFQRSARDFSPPLGAARGGRRALGSCPRPARPIVARARAPPVFGRGMAICVMIFLSDAGIPSAPFTWSLADWIIRKPAPVGTAMVDGCDAFPRARTSINHMQRLRVPPPLLKHASS